MDTDRDDGETGSFRLVRWFASVHGIVERCIGRPEGWIGGMVDGIGGMRFHVRLDRVEGGNDTGVEVE